MTDPRDPQQLNAHFTINEVHNPQDYETHRYLLFKVSGFGEKMGVFIDRDYTEEQWLEKVNSCLSALVDKTARGWYKYYRSQVDGD